MALVLITLQDNADGDTVINVQSEPFIDLHTQPADDASGAAKAAWIALNAIASAPQNVGETPTPNELQPV